MERGFRKGEMSWSSSRMSCFKDYFITSIFGNSSLKKDSFVHKEVQQSLDSPTRNLSEMQFGFQTMLVLSPNIPTEQT